MYQIKLKYVAVLTMNIDSNTKGENVKPTKNRLERKQVTNLLLFEKQKEGGVKLFLRA